MDIGGTTIKVAKASSIGNLIELYPLIDTPHNIDLFFETMLQIKEKYYTNQCSGIAISMPGILAASTGYVKNGGALRYIHDIHLKDELEYLLGCPVGIGNDANCAALGEQVFGELQGVANGISLVLGTGLGCGLIINHHIYEGAHLAAGEVSFVNVTSSPDLTGIAVAKLSAVGLIKEYFKNKDGKVSTSDGELFFEAYATGDQTAVVMLETYCSTLAIQLFNLQAILDPEKIVIGGGISKQNMLFNVIDKAMIEYKKATHGLIRKPEIIQSKLGNHANLLGACVNFMNQMINQ